MVLDGQITNSITTPEVAFTGDTTSDFVVDENNADALKARVLVMEVIIFPSVDYMY